MKFTGWDLITYKNKCYGAPTCYQVIESIAQDNNTTIREMFNQDNERIYEFIDIITHNILGCEVITGDWNPEDIFIEKTCFMKKYHIPLRDYDYELIKEYGGRKWIIELIADI